MAKEAVFTMKLESELRAEFLAAAAANDRPASQVVRELMRGYIAHQSQARDYDGYLRGKVKIARASMRAGRGHSNEKVEAEFASKRSRTTSRARLNGTLPFKNHF